jgi:hypothetical protein
MRPRTVHFASTEILAVSFKCPGTLGRRGYVCIAVTTVLMVLRTVSHLGLCYLCSSNSTLNVTDNRSIFKYTNIRMSSSSAFVNYILTIAIYSIYSVQGRSYKIVPITNLTKISTWTESYKQGKIKIILAKNTKKQTLCLMVSWFSGKCLVVCVCRFCMQSLGLLVCN